MTRFALILAAIVGSSALAQLEGAPPDDGRSSAQRSGHEGNGDAHALPATRAPAACGGLFTHSWFPQAEVFVPVQVGGTVPVSGVHEASPGPGGVTTADVGTMADALSEPVAVLAAVVATVAAMPVVLYALDVEPTQDLRRCWEMPSTRFNFQGGASSGMPGSSGVFAARLNFGVAFLGVEAGGETGSFRRRGADAHLLFRLPPRQRVELNVGLGVRTFSSGDSGASWWELSLPHRYYPWRRGSWEPGVAFELRPAVLWANAGLDFRLDAAVDLPMSPWASLQLGGRAFSFNGQVHLAALGGFSVSP